MVDKYPYKGSLSVTDKSKKLMFYFSIKLIQKLNQAREKSFWLSFETSTEIFRQRNDIKKFQMLALMEPLLTA